MTPMLDWHGVLSGQPLQWIISGFLTTVWVSVAGILLATLLAVLLLALRLGGGRAGRGLVAAWVSLFRNTPLLVQLLFWYFAAWNLLPLAVKEVVNDEHAWSILPGNVWWLTPEFLCSMWGLGVFTSAFLVEEIASGLRAVSHGQREAALSQGFTPWQELRFILTAVQLDLVINLIQILILHIARPVQRQGFTIYQIDRGDLQLGRIQTDRIDCILNRVIAQPFFPARIAVALAVINIQPAAGHIRRFAVLIRSVVQSLAVCAVENRINLTAFHVDFDADCSIQHTFIVGILRKKRTDERTVTRQLAFCVFACIQTNAVNTADQIFPVLIRLIKRLIQHAFLLHLAAE